MPIESLTPLRYVIRSEQSAADDRYVLDPHVRISLALDPTFVAAIQQLGGDADGDWAFAWRGGVSADCPALLALVAPELLSGFWPAR